MLPGTYNLTVTENAKHTQTFTIAGIVTAVGYTAKVDMRAGEKPTDTLVLALTSSPTAGLVLSSGGSSLSIAMTLTEAQVDLIADAIQAGVMWSLKVTDPAGGTLQYLKGKVTITRTPSA